MLRIPRHTHNNTHHNAHTQKQERGPHRTHSFSVLVRGTTKLGNREGVTSPLADSDPWSGGGEDSDPSAAIKTRTLGFKGGSQVCFFLKNKKTKTLEFNLIYFTLISFNYYFMMKSNLGPV